MKKVTVESRKYQVRVTWLRNKRRLVSRDKLKQLNRFRSAGSVNYDHAYRVDKNNYTLVLPEKFGLRINHEQTVRALKELRTLSGMRSIRLKLDFSKIKLLGSTASLALASEVDRWRNLIPAPLVTKQELWSNEIKLAFNQMGLFQLLGMSYDGKDISHSDRTFVKFIFGSKAEGSSAKKMRMALEEVANACIDSHPVFIGLTEAMANVAAHAYDRKNEMQRIFGVRCPWWLGGAYSASNDSLTITICDQGVGIPKTLPRKYGFEKIKAVLGKLGGTRIDDASMIEAAFEVGRTATGLPQHGKGLQQIRQFIENYENSSLRILSLRGEYLYVRDSGKVTERKINHREAINGTIIEWRILNVNKYSKSSG